MTLTNESTNPAKFASLCLSTSVANRVSVVVSLFFGHLAGIYNTDQFDVQQGVELRWRELGGHGRSRSQRRAVTSHLPEFRQQASASPIRGATAVLPALDAIAALVDEEMDERERLKLVVAHAFGVALEFDLLGVPAPEGAATWAGFELRGQAAIFDALSPSSPEVSEELVYELRTNSGMEAMNYWRAIRELLRSQA
ncbi:hypothetical protein ACLQ29_06515 [Micromonospora sp. DT228]|uniref:hypothetical protein n=1 Tax=Micromonospora sp. DT228 TaxID=3393443 RepID=UPI003CF871EE